MIRQINVYLFGKREMSHRLEILQAPAILRRYGISADGIDGSSFVPAYKCMAKWARGRPFSSFLAARNLRK